MNVHPAQQIRPLAPLDRSSNRRAWCVPVKTKRPNTPVRVLWIYPTTRIHPNGLATVRTDPNVKTNVRVGTLHPAQYMARATVEHLGMESVSVKRTTTVLHAVKNVVATQANAPMAQLEMAPVFANPTCSVRHATTPVIATQAHATMEPLVMERVHAIGRLNLVAAAVRSQPWAVSLLSSFYSFVPRSFTLFDGGGKKNTEPLLK